MNKQQYYHPGRDEGGALMIDALVAILLSTILAIGLTQSMLVAYRYSHKEIADSTAAQIAMERLEQFASVDPETLGDGDQTIETNVVRNNISFRIQSDVAIDANRARNVTVQVTTERTKLPTNVTLQSSYTLWGER